MQYLRGAKVRVRRLSTPPHDLFDKGEVVYADRCEVTVKLLDGTHVTVRRSSERLEPDDGTT